jgi:hypothetical protein
MNESHSKCRSVYVLLSVNASSVEYRTSCKALFPLVLVKRSFHDASWQSSDLNGSASVRIVLSFCAWIYYVIQIKCKQMSHAVMQLTNWLTS